MAIALVQQASAAFGSQVGGVVTLPANTQAGNALIIVVSQSAASTGALISTITDDGATHATYVKPAALAQAGPPPSDNQSGVNSLIALAYALAIPAGIRNVTVTLASAKTHAVSVSEWSGIVAASPSDASANGGGSVAGTTFRSPAISPPTAGDLVIGAINQAAAALTFSGGANSTPASGWTELVQLAPSASRAGIGYQVFSGVPPASTRVAWTGTSGKWGAIAMAFKADVSGAALTVDIDDTVALADDLSLAAVTSIDDAAGVADGLTPLLATQITQNVNDALAVADALIKAPATSIADAIAVADTPALAVSASIADAIGVADALTPALATQITQNVNDAIAVADGLALGLGLNLADAAAVADALAKTSSSSLADAIGVADALTPALSIALTQNVNDAIGVADALTPALAAQITQNVNDAIGVADALTNALSTSLADALAVADVLAASSSKPLADAIGVADVATPVLSLALAQTINDALAVADALVKASTSSTADAIGVADSLTTAAAMRRELADVLDVLDALVMVIPGLIIGRRDARAPGFRGTGGAGVREALSPGRRDVGSPGHT